TVAAKLCPEVAYIKEELLSLGALGALVSGSGPAVFGIFEGTGGAEGAARALSRPRRRTWAARPWRSIL
ncbi:MAG: 4-(cytidine 5'-diphospho)-2-C-methyl-D-erythritol kinase, partial [Actinomycetota bacterium]